MSDGPNTEQPGQDPDAQPNSDEGAASGQAAQAGEKEQSEGSEDKA